MDGPGDFQTLSAAAQIPLRAAGGFQCRRSGYCDAAGLHRGL